MPETIYKITTPRTIIRRYEESDAQALTDALIDSNQHLRRWLPFAESDDWSVEDQLQKIQDWRSKFETDGDNVFGVFDPQSGSYIGSIGYHKRVGEGGIEIGYWARVARANKGYMTECASALIKLAFVHYGYDRVEIHCRPDNLASARIPAKLGFEYEATLKRRVKASDGWKDLAIFTLFRENFDQDPRWDGIEINAYNKYGACVFPITLTFEDMSCCGL